MSRNLSQWIQSERREVVSLKGEISTYKSNLEHTNGQIKKLESRVETYEEVVKFFRDLSETLQKHLHDQFAKISTSCLQTVFDESYKVGIEFESKRNSTEAQISLWKGDLEMSPSDSTGFGVLDVLGFSLRLAAIKSTNQCPPVLIMDEAFRHVSQDHRETLAQLCSDLSSALGIQIIHVTHIKELEIGKVIEV